MRKFVALATYFFPILVLCLLSFHRIALAAGAVEMQVEHMISLSIDEYNQAMESGDPEGWLRYFTDNVSRNGLLSVQKGKGQFAEYYRWEFRNFQAKCVPKKIWVSGRTAAVLFAWDAVHKPSGNPVQVEMVGVYEMAASGKIESVSFYYDTAKVAKFFAESGSGSN
jgi:ketosteroid isomerase-like protein